MSDFKTDWNNEEHQDFKVVQINGQSIPLASYDEMTSTELITSQIKTFLPTEITVPIENDLIPLTSLYDTTIYYLKHHHPSYHFQCRPLPCTLRPDASNRRQSEKAAPASWSRIATVSI